MSDKRYLKTCMICRKDYYSEKRNSTTCSPKCRQQFYRDRASIKREAMRIKQSLDVMVANALEPGPYQNDAWIAIVGLSSYLARVISDSTMEAMEL